MDNIVDDIFVGLTNLAEGCDMEGHVPDIVQEPVALNRLIHDSVLYIGVVAVQFLPGIDTDSTKSYVIEEPEPMECTYNLSAQVF
jgi:hypothetical protein